jgi:putative ABC transport system substrate-binding protein
MKRLLLGIILIVATSAVLLVTDSGQRKSGPGRVPRVALLQHATQALLDEGVEGILAALADAGFVDKKTVQIQRYNAEGDIATANAIAKEITDRGFDLIVTVTTISLQTVASANRGGVRHVFGFVSDPFSAGVGLDRDNPGVHPKHLVGLGSMPLVEESFRVARQIYPGLKRVGAAWNPAESNSVANIKLARKISGELGIELVEANVENASAVQQACESLIARDVEALWVGGDLTMIIALDAVVASARRAHIPVFTSIAGNAERGALFDVGSNPIEIGKAIGALAAKVLGGADPARIPVRNFAVQRLVLNRGALAGLKDPWVVPAETLARSVAPRSTR